MSQCHKFVFNYDKCLFSFFYLNKRLKWKKDTRNRTCEINNVSWRRDTLVKLIRVSCAVTDNHVHFLWLSSNRAPMKRSQGPALTELFKLPFLLRTTATHVTQSRDFPHCCCNAAYLQKTERETLMALPESSVFGITSIVIHEVSHFKKRIENHLFHIVYLPQLTGSQINLTQQVKVWKITQGHNCRHVASFQSLIIFKHHEDTALGRVVSGLCAFCKGHWDIYRI